MRCGISLVSESGAKRVLRILLVNEKFISSGVSFAKMAEYELKTYCYVSDDVSNIK